MKRQGLLLLGVALAGLGLGLLCSGSAYAVTSELISDFDVTEGDEQVAIMNPFGSNSCALIYVFNGSQTLQDCCGCLLSGNDLLDLSVENSLLVNSTAESGLIEILPSQPTPSSGACDPTKPPVGTGTVLEAVEYEFIQTGLFVIAIPDGSVNKVSSFQSSKTFFANVSVGDAATLARLCAAPASSCSCRFEELGPS